MLTGEPIAPGPAALAEARQYLRVEGDREDALVARLIASAAEYCEQFTGRVLLARGFSEILPVADGTWRRLARTPVRAITGVQAVDAAGTASPLPAGAHAIDIDAAGDGWVRVIDAGAAAGVRVAYQAGLAPAWEDLPEPLAHGAIRLAAHLYTSRGARDDPAPPAVVSALWRPFRRLRIGGAGHV